jgi:hypothetical protein
MSTHPLLAVVLLRTDQLVSWGHAPKPPGSASPKSQLKNVFCKAGLISFQINFGVGLVSLVQPTDFCEAEQRFLLLFLEKEEYCWINQILCGFLSQKTVVSFRKGLKGG